MSPEFLARRQRILPAEGKMPGRRRTRQEAIRLQVVCQVHLVMRMPMSSIACRDHRDASFILSTFPGNGGGRQNSFQVASCAGVSQPRNPTRLELLLGPVDAERGSGHALHQPHSHRLL